MSQEEQPPQEEPQEEEEVAASYDEVVGNLETYKQQHREVKLLLEVESGNAEYLEALQGLEEVVKLTEELLETMQPAPKAFVMPIGM